ncbi:ATP-dependent RNA helicase RhlE [Draconibacterium orientale]|uniref:ATP-dependent RNA helicase RhlE n=1 Tax=Draconibacterium orientale TaxID=1168034 RepID=A0A1I0JDG0_9BACT|nr:DEAD/DEAH box helicase [Draconibacterium orientale]SEU08004.1 ATP-dependent RNA helicase RhlE [Draconibacterium orientale]
MNNNRYKNNTRKRTPRKKVVSTIDPALLVKQAVKVETVPFIAEQTFEEMPLSETLKNNIRMKGYIEPTEIQQKSISDLIAGRNMIGIAATGTGKTGAFLIPVIEKMLADNTTTCLVVVPTRELAQQVEDEFKSLTRGHKLFSACFIGGTSVNTDMGKARRKQNLIVGTPGRLNDLTSRGTLRLGNTPILVLDEFDRMLDMGFINDIKKIIALMKNRKQTMLFSATYEKAQQNLIKQFVQNPVRINVSRLNNAADTVEQDIIRVGDNENKFQVLYNLLNGDGFEKVILFAETKRNVDKISQQLRKVGINSDVIHGNKSQNYRTKAIRMFKMGKTRVLVATDVAARGIDVDGVTHVINYQLPQTMDSYIHRIGRTGRAGKKGMAYTFVN